jgi:hypothetical protein
MPFEELQGHKEVNRPKLLSLSGILALPKLSLNEQNKT